MTTFSGAALSASAAGLARQVRGRVIGPDSPDWDGARRPWNLRVDQRPLMVAEADDPDDIAATAAYAARHGLQVAAQASGHGAEGSIENAILLRASGLRDITIDPGQQRARVGAGVSVGDLMTALSPHGLALSAGTSSDVGVTGYVMFGGVGVLGRALGFAAGHVRGADVVTADGTMIRADATSHEDLFWALRGGGGGFALVTHLDLALARVPALFGGQLIWSADAAPEVFGAWASWVPGLNSDTTSSACVFQFPPLPQLPEALRGRRVAIVTICHAGAADQAMSLLDPITSIGTPLASTLRPLSVADLSTLYGPPVPSVPARNRSGLLTDLPGPAVREFVAQTGPASSSPLQLAEVRHLGGAYAQPPQQSGGPGAIGRTDAQFLVQLVAVAPSQQADAAARGYQDSVMAALGPWTTGTTLPSFADPGTDPGRLFSPATRQRLADVKYRYDPANVICTSFPVTA
jgi:hypothetical protein